MFAFAGMQTLHAQQIKSVEYIRSLEQETTLLVFNKLFGEQISSHKNDSQLNFSGNSHVASAGDNNEKVFINDKQLIDAYFDKSLTVSLKKIQQIRAP